MTTDIYTIVRDLITLGHLETHADYTRVTNGQFALILAVLFVFRPKSGSFNQYNGGVEFG